MLALTRSRDCVALSTVARADETTAFNPDRGQADPDACKMAMGQYGGFWGPFVFP